MALAIASQSSFPIAVATCVITKPTGLSVGDLMLACIYGTGNGNDTTDKFTPPSGWTKQIFDGDGSGVNMGYVFWKIADSSDTSATNFTFTNSNGGTTNGGIIYRITGHDPITPIKASNKARSTAFSAVYTNTVTPSADNLLFFFISGTVINSTGSVSTYAITNDNPTWTEDIDTTRNEGGYWDRFAVASSSVRSQSTATGDSSASITGSGSIWTVGFMIAVQPVQSVANSNFFAFF